MNSTRNLYSENLLCFLDNILFCIIFKLKINSKKLQNNNQLNVKTRIL